jgi:hypothetical protein
MSFRIIEGDGVDGKVAPSQILKQGSAELDFVWSALVRIFRFGTVGSNFNYREPGIL